MREVKNRPKTIKECSQHLLPVRDVLDLLDGKWKIPIIVVLLTGSRRFNTLKVEIEGISAKMLSKELKELEINELVKREVHDTMPVSVEYSITDYGQTLETVIAAMSKWGQQTRDRIMG